MPAPSVTVPQSAARPAPSGRRGNRRRTAPAPGGPAGPADPARPSGPAGRTGGTGGGGGATADPAGEVVRWAAFCCVLVPVVLVVYGTSLGGAAGAALGLAAVTAVCRLLLRRSERGLRAESAAPGGRRSGGGRGPRRNRRPSDRQD
ncbi:hypothetical protein ACIGBL_11610 [Streptomyces sp. NPDC085614]|uniref:hypothetical protein n=1 Tax=unclassified Streptomyces TaxID=2593676 RepID=UPI0021C68B60|nr:hypothetical protein [Streptomyces sp. ms191]